MEYPYLIQNLISQFQKLPGIGYKNAERLVLYILQNFNLEDISEFSEYLVKCKKNIKKCEECGNFTENNICIICEDKNRQRNIICVVHTVKDLISLEKTGVYNGIYHILGGYLSPVDGISLEDLNIKKLLERIKNSKEDIKEIILATNYDLEGETLSEYIKTLLENTEIKITKLASGIAVGSDLTYSDERTLCKAIEGRREY